MIEHLERSVTSCYTTSTQRTVLLFQHVYHVATNPILSPASSESEIHVKLHRLIKTGIHFIIELASVIGEKVGRLDADIKASTEQ